MTLTPTPPNLTPAQLRVLALLPPDGSWDFSFNTETRALLRSLCRMKDGLVERSTTSPVGFRLTSAGLTFRSEVLGRKPSP